MSDIINNHIADDAPMFDDDDDAITPQALSPDSWKIMLVDDEDAIHQVTKLALADFTFENRGLTFISAYSAQEARQLIEQHPDTALLLLDVVMETDQAGLTIIKYIRETLGNSFVRIILRTGQPGQAPEETIIVNYDINDYKAKTELTTQKLFTTVISALRSYRDIITLDKIATAHRQAEEALRESEAKSQALLNAIPDLMFRINREGIYIDFRGSADDDLGVPPEAFLGKSLSEVLPATLAQKRMYFVEQALKTGQIQVYEYQFAPAGTLYDYEDRVVVSGENEVLTIARNITTRKQAEQERLRLSAIERELKLAHDIQQNLQPPSYPDWPTLDVVCYSAPTRQVGGDFYSYYAFDGAGAEGRGDQVKNGQTHLPDIKRFGIVVGDVSGKGMPAALLMAVSLASFESIVKQGLAPKELMASLDKTLISYTRTHQQNCAMIYVEVSQTSLREEITLRVANAGCIPPLLKQPTGSIKWIEVGGLPLGTGSGEEVGYEEISLGLAKGELIILTSDGVIEAKNATGEMFGFERLEQVVATGPVTNAQAMLDHLKVKISEFVGETEPHDDVTIVVIQI